MSGIHANENLSSEPAIALEPDSSWVATTEIRIFDEFKNIPTAALSVPLILKNFFERMHIQTLRDLNALSLDDVAKTPHYGKKAAAELHLMIERFGYGDPRERIEVSSDKAEILREWRILVDSGVIESTLSEQKQKISIPARFGNVSVNVLPFSRNLRSVLCGLRILRLADLEQLSIRDLAKTFQCGRRSVLELQSFITALRNCETAEAKTDLAAGGASNSERTGRINQPNELIASINECLSESVDPPGTTLAPNASRIRADELVRKVLENSAVPLTPKEIIERGMEMFGEERVSRSTDSVIGVVHRRSDIYLLDRRRIGLRRHFRLPPERWDEMKGDVFDLLKGSSGRTFSTKEIISEEIFGWTALTTAEEAAQILREDSRFTRLAGFQFGLATSEIRAGRSLTDSLLEILQNAGQPMNVGDIVRELRNSRSVPKTSVYGRIKKIEEIEDYGNGFCGLIVWDENIVRAFLVKNDVFVLRTVQRAKPPFNFDDLCRRINIKASGEQADELWKTLRRSPRVNLGSQEVRETVLIELGKADTNAARKRKLRKSKDSHELFPKSEV